MLLSSIRTRLLGLVLATVAPLAALIGVGLWNQWRLDETTAIERALSEARLLAAQVDDHIGNLDNLLIGLSRAVSTNPADVLANDVLLQKVRSELPDFVSNILVFSLDGSNIGTSADPNNARPHAASRAYFQQVLAGQRLSIGDVIRAQVNNEWLITVARPIEDQAGRLQGVMAVGTRLAHFQDALKLRALPPGSVVRVVNEKGIVVVHSANGPNWIGRDLSHSEHVIRHIVAQEANEIVPWSDNIERITGSSTAHSVPWLVSVGIPTDVAFATIASRLTWGALFIIGTLMAAFAIAWMLSGHIVAPLLQLRKDASALADGNLSHRTAVSTRDEVGVLADAFNRMAASLEQRQAEADRAAEEMRQAKDTLTTVIDASPVAIICSDPDRRIFLWNRSAEKIFGYSAEEAMGQPANLVPAKDAEESRGLFRRALEGETLRNLRRTRRRKDGTLVNVRVAAAPMYHTDGTVRGVARAYEDITEQVRAEDQLKRVAHYDQLTGLPNRLSLQKELGRLLAGDGYGKSNAIALFDLDGFKDVNDTLGHSIGDQLLIEVGQRLAEVTGNRGSVYRLGGDEFIIILPGCGDPVVIGGLAAAVLKQLAQPFEVYDHVLHVGGSAGIAIAPADGANPDELIANADLALYQAKAEGGRSYRFFLPVLRAQAQARRSLDLELRRGFANNEFELYFQPQIRLIDETVVGAEALIRWRHPVRGVLAPGMFIETLGTSAIAPEVSRWIMRSACEQTSAWRSKGLPLGRIGVNLFPSQLSNEALLKDIDDALRETGLPPEALELEITENVALNFEHGKVLQKIHERGVKIAFDDFGTGYASLSYLTRFPLSRIKIDRSFISKITDDAGDAAIVRSLTAMAHNLGLHVIAEGVETGAQAAFLLNEGCEEAQGYYYAKPMTAADFEAYLRTRRLSFETSTAEKRPTRRFERSAVKPVGRRRVRGA